MVHLGKQGANQALFRSPVSAIPWPSVLSLGTWNQSFCTLTGAMDIKLTVFVTA